MKKWREAREYCRELGGDLTAIMSKYQQSKSFVFVQFSEYDDISLLPKAQNVSIYS